MPEGRLEGEVVATAEWVDLIVQGVVELQHGHDVAGSREGLWEQPCIHPADDLQAGRRAGGQAGGRAGRQAG